MTKSALRYDRLHREPSLADRDARATQVGQLVEVTRNVEEIGICEDMLSILETWPGLTTRHREIVSHWLEHMRAAGRITFATGQSIRRLHTYLGACRSNGTTPGSRPSRRPRAKFQRAPLAAFMSDASLLPKAPPGRRKAAP